MTKIWFARDGDDPRTAERRYVRPLQECAKQLGMSPRQQYCPLDGNPAINNPSQVAQDYQHVICRVDQQESSELGWEPGFYRLGVTPKEVANRLGPPG